MKTLPPPANSTWSSGNIFYNKNLWHYNGFGMVIGSGNSPASFFYWQSVFYLGNER